MGLFGRSKSTWESPYNLCDHRGFAHLIHYHFVRLAGRVFAALVTNGTGSLTCRLAGSLALAASALLHGIL